MARRRCPSCRYATHKIAEHPAPRRYAASPECFDLFAELTTELVADDPHDTWYQLAVDAYSAQHAGPHTVAGTLWFGLAGLHLSLDHHFTGTEVHWAHQWMAEHTGTIPNLLLPTSGPRTRWRRRVINVLDADPGELRERALIAWATEVWDAYSAVHGALALSLPTVARLRRRLNAEGMPLDRPARLARAAKFARDFELGESEHLGSAQSRLLDVAALALPSLIIPAHPPTNAELAGGSSPHLPTQAPSPSLERYRHYAGRAAPAPLLTTAWAPAQRAEWAAWGDGPEWAELADDADEFADGVAISRAEVRAAYASPRSRSGRAGVLDELDSPPARVRRRAGAPSHDGDQRERREQFSVADSPWLAFVERRTRNVAVEPIEAI